MVELMVGAFGYWRVSPLVCFGMVLVSSTCRNLAGDVGGKCVRKKSERLLRKFKHTKKCE